MYSQLPHGPAHLRGTLMFDLAAALGRKPGVGDNAGITCSQGGFTGLVRWRNLPDQAMR